MTVSVIVPTHNRVALLQQNVESLLGLDFTDREIIIVNDGSTDGTDRYLSSLETSAKIVYVKQDNRGPAAARNAAEAGKELAGHGKRALSAHARSEEKRDQLRV